MIFNVSVTEISSLASVDEDSWNKLLGKKHPFLLYAFLYGLELSGCVSERNGWKTRFITAHDDNGELIAALPCYQKDHSYGEYIFDWAWADAYQRAHLNYYPKLSCAVPFTPATGPRLLISPSLTNKQSQTVTQTIITKLIDIAESENLSSIHVLFNQKEIIQSFEKKNFFLRKSSQFHWLNQINDPKNNQNYYDDFEHFLAQLSSRKRKNIKRERRRVTEAKVNFKWFNSDALNETVVEHMFAMYQNTIRRYGAQQYLNRDFFIHISKTMPENMLILLAYHGEEVIAGGLYFRDKKTLYGRYWGAAEDYHSLHFETCYYQAIEYCIDNKLERFEAGAQGEHKLSRGLLPHCTYSLHWLLDKRFNDAVKNYVDEESTQIDRYQHLLNSHSPFKEL